MDEPTQGEFRPPYLSFTTFWSFLEAMVSQPLPPKIDRSMMRSKSGSDQVGLTAALKAFGLVDDDQVVTGLRELQGSDEAARIRWLAEVVRKYYPAQMAVSEQNGTEQQLKESFRDSFQMGSADTIRKAMTFYLHAARTADIETSPHFPVTRSGSGAPGTPKPRRVTTKRKSSSDVGKATEKASVLQIEGDTYTLSLESGPVVTLAVKMNVMEASVSDRNFIFKLVDALRGYGKHPSTSGSQNEAAAGDTDSAEDPP
ncbi:MAG: hypothetical protein ACLP7J_02140 [Streptosporangiaceae bacterium]